MNIDWSSVIPIWITQPLWSLVIVLSVVVIVRVLLRREGDRVAATLTPFLKRVEQLGFVSAEQASMNATALERVINKQGDATTQVAQVPELTADKMVERFPQGEIHNATLAHAGNGSNK